MKYAKSSARLLCFFFFFSSRRRHTRSLRDWSSDVCSSDLGGRHAGGPTVSRRICRDFGGSGIRQANARVEPKMILPARGAIALARVFIAQAGQFVAAADAIAIAGFRSSFDGNESHEAPSRAR